MRTACFDFAILYEDKHIRLTGKDGGHVVFTDVWIPYTYFDKFDKIETDMEYDEVDECDYEVPHMDEFTIEDLYKATKLCKGDLSWEDAGNKYNFKNTNQRFGVTKTANLQTFVAGDFSTVEFPCSFPFSLKLIKDIIDKLTVYGEKMYIRVESGKLFVKGIASQGDEKEIEYDIEYKGEEEFHSEYGYAMFKYLNSAVKLTEELTINFGTNFPMQFVFNLEGEIVVNMIMAPRVPDDEDTYGDN